jgi:16S rRNA C967 or C1407 C5-methylase (RsmB/RsmF family)
MRTNKAKQQSGAKAFRTHYAKQYGEERWKSLYTAMQSSKRHCCLINKYSNAVSAGQDIGIPQTSKQIPFISIPCLAVDGEVSHPSKDDQNQVLNYYVLDGASVMAVDALDVQPTDKVLDLCAAPGGKSVALLQHISLGQGTLHCNEVDTNRFHKLKRVVTEYVPLAYQKSLTFSHYNATSAFHFGNNTYDRVLVDAPCSSDRHLVNNADEMAKWTPKNALDLSKTQVLLLITALECVKIGGTVVYATCSISNAENDDVIDKVIVNRRGLASVVVTNERKFGIGEPTKHGWIVLPDDKTEPGWGPLYICVLRRVEQVKAKVEYSDSSDDDSSDEDSSDEN